jgi:ribonuclease HI
MTEVTIYTDGAWAAIVKLDGSDALQELSGGERGTSNQKMEIRAVIEGGSRPGEG